MKKDNKYYTSYDFNSIAGMRPDDSFGINLHRSITLIDTSCGRRLVRAERLVGYYWDEDDHRKPDFWVCNANNERICKMEHLSIKSRKKLYKAFKNIMSPES